MCFRVKTTSCTTFSEPQSSCTDFSMLSLPPFQIPTHPPGGILCRLEFAPFFILLTRTVGNTRGIVKSCSLKEEHTTPHACKNCNLGSPNKACAGDGGRRANTGIKFHTSCEGGRGEKDGLCPFKRRSSSSLTGRQCPSPCPAQPLTSLPKASQPCGTSSAPPSCFPRGNVEASPSC